MASQLRVDEIIASTGSSVAIGTAGGSVTLAGDFTVDTSKGLNVGTGATIFSPSSNVLTLGTNNTERVRISSDGSVGIGTDNPDRKLESVDTANSLTYPVAVSNHTSASTGVGAAIDFRLASNGVTRGELGLVYAGNNNSDGTDFVLKPNDGSTGNIERLRIKGSNGNIGIGTDNPGANIHLYDSSQPRIRLDRSDAPRNNFIAAYNADELVLAADHDNAGSASAIRFFVDGGEKVKINDSGNIVILTSGAGIDFSATADGSGTTTSELFNDYEEGTWTPQVIQGVTGTPTYEYQLGWYTKIGRIVTLYFYIRFASTGNTGSNSIFQVGNFPFPVVSTNNGTLQRGMGVSNYHSIPGFTSANASFYGGGNSNTFASMYQGNNSVATTSAVNSQYIIGGFEYISE